MVLDIKATQNNESQCNHLLQVLIYSLIIMVNTNKIFNKLYTWHINVTLNHLMNFFK